MHITKIHTHKNNFNSSIIKFKTNALLQHTFKEEVGSTTYYARDVKCKNVNNGKKMKAHSYLKTMCVHLKTVYKSYTILCRLHIIITDNNAEAKIPI